MKTSLRFLTNANDSQILENNGKLDNTNNVNTFTRWQHLSDHIRTINCRHLANVYE